MLEKMTEDILQTSYHNVQSDIRSVLYNVVEKLIFERLCKDAIGEIVLPTH